MWLGNYKLSVNIGNALSKEHFYELFINTIMYGTAKKINKLLNGFFTEATTILLHFHSNTLPIQILLSHK